MRWLQTVRLRLRSIFLRGTVERELAEELQFHLDALIEENLAAGLPPEEARLAARRSLGGMDQLQEECRDLRRTRFIDDLGNDLRYALGVLRRTPGFALVAIVTLALGIGATTAIFSVVRGVLLKPLPFAEPDRLVGVWHQGFNHGPGTFFTYRDGNQVFEDIGAWKTDEVSITGRGEPERVQALTVSDATLSLLRVKPALGRFFNQADDRPRSPLSVVLSYGHWQRKFGGARDVLGRTVDIDGTPGTIIGVSPASFRFLRADPAVLLPLRLDRGDAPNAIFDFQILARLKPGITPEHANADVARLIAFLPKAYAPYKLQPDVRPLAHEVTGNVADVLWILLASVGIVLLIAGANVANLFLVRAEARQQEFAVRAALGANRGRIARQLLTESLMLALAGGVVGLGLARAGIGMLKRMAAATLPRADEIAIDAVVLLFTLGISLLTGLLFGLLPGLRLARASASALKYGGGGAGDAPARQRTRNILVVAEVGMALVLLVGSGLMIRTFLSMRNVQPGFVRSHEVQTFRIDVPEALVPEPEQMARTHEQIAERLRQVAGVASVGLSSSITMDGEDNTNPIYVEHVHAPYAASPPHRRFKAHTPGYFETMGNHLVAGRDITWTDIYQSRPVIVISQALARAYWPDPAAALGKRLGSPEQWFEIVGVVGDERDDGLTRPATPIVYWPLLNPRYAKRSMAYAVRSPRVGAPGFLRELQQAVSAVNPNLPLARVQTLEQIEVAAMAQTAFVMVMLAIAATVALFLGLVGVYGVISYIVAQRTREIGIRISLGAEPKNVRRLFLRHGLALCGTGIALGLVVSLGLTRIMSALLFGVGPEDPLTYAIVSIGLAAMALLATWLPARRASCVDPMIALRAET